MNIISWNVNGIRAVVKKGFWEWFHETRADIICLQETKAFPTQVNKELHTPHGYHSYWHNGTKKGYAGVVVYSKIPANLVKRSFPEVPEIFTNEGRILELHFNHFILLNIYFPNGNPRTDREDMITEKLKFYKSFLKHIHQLRGEGKALIACGDYNIAHTELDLARPEENEESIGFLPVEREWISKILASGYVDVFRALNPHKADSYTWWSYRSRARERNVGWRLDYFIINEELRTHVLSMTHQERVLGSDHCPIHMNIDIAE